MRWCPISGANYHPAREVKTAFGVVIIFRYIFYEGYRRDVRGSFAENAELFQKCEAFSGKICKKTFCVSKIFQCPPLTPLFLFFDFFLFSLKKRSIFKKKKKTIK